MINFTRTYFWASCLKDRRLWKGVESNKFFLLLIFSRSSSLIWKSMIDNIFKETHSPEREIISLFLKTGRLRFFFSFPLDRSTSRVQKFRQFLRFVFAKLSKGNRNGKALKVVIRRPCVLGGRYNVSEEHTASMLRTAFNMAAVCSSETFVCAYKSTRRCYAPDQYQHLRHRDNLRSQF
jgi:hypothetical protein